MKRTFKKAVSVFLVVAMLLCAAPLNGFAADAAETTKDTIVFGSYVWDVLKTEDDGDLVLITKDVLAKTRFNTRAPINFATSTLYTTLNTDLYGAFTDAEKAAITPTTITYDYWDATAKAKVTGATLSANVVLPDAEMAKSLGIACLAGTETAAAYYLASARADKATDVVVNAISKTGTASNTSGTSATATGYRAVITLKAGSFVKFPAVDGVSFTVNDKAVTYYTTTSDVAFKVVVDTENYAADNMAVTLGGEALTAADGVYTIPAGSIAPVAVTGLTAQPADFTAYNEALAQAGEVDRDLCETADLDAALAIDVSACTKLEQAKVDAATAAILDAIANLQHKIISGTIGTKLSWSIDKATKVLTINNDGAMVSFASDDAPWKAYKEYVHSVVVNDGCTNISNSAFKNCSYLKAVDIPYSVTTIDDYAFYNCTSLTSVTIPDSVTSIGYCAFSFCDSLTSVTIPDSVTTIGDYAFYWCDSLTSVTIPDSVTSIEWYAFAYCTSLTNVTIGNSVTTIDSYAFADCDSLTSVKIPDSVTTIGKSAFQSCDSLSAVTVGSGAETIDDYAFANCAKLYDVYIYSKTCTIYESSITINATIHGYAGSTAETFADKYGYNFEPIVDISCDVHTYTDTCDATCDVCGAKREITHSYGEWTIIKEPTCTSTGAKQRICSVCSNVEKETIPTIPHSYGEWTIIKEATCTSTGAKQRLCSAGGCVEKATIEIVPHTDANDDGICEVCKTQFEIKYPMHGVCGPNLTWTLDDDGVLTIEGTGSMYNFNSSYSDDYITVYPGAEEPTRVEMETTMREHGSALEEESGYDIVTWDDRSFVDQTTTRKTPVNTTKAPVKTTKRPVSYPATQRTTSYPTTTNPDDYYHDYNYNSANDVTPIEEEVCSVRHEESTTAPEIVLQAEAPDVTTRYYDTSTEEYYPPTTIVDWDYPETTIVDWVYPETTHPGNVKDDYIIVYRWNKHIDKIKKVVISDGVTSIGNYAFSDCTNLVEVDMPDSIKSIGVYAFNNCYALKEVEIPQSTNSIGYYALRNCYALDTVNFNAKNCGSIYYNAFYNTDVRTLNIGAEVNYIPKLYTVETVTFAAGATVVPYGAFCGCDNLTTVNLPDSIIIIGDEAFGKCNRIAEITIPENVRTIGSYAFSNCSSLGILNFNAKNCNNIYYNAFYCTSVKTLNIGAGVNYIPNFSGLETVTFADGATVVPDNSFDECRNLTTVNLPDSITRIGDNAFYNCRSLLLSELPKSTTYIGSNAFGNCDLIKELTIGENVETICNNAFYSCSSLEILNFNAKDCYEVYYYAFNYCPIKTLNVGADVRYLPENLSSVEIVTFAEGATTVPANAFYYYTKLRTVNLPDSITSIGEAAFAYCYSLESFKVGNNVTSIGPYAFYNCRSLRTVTLGENITEIGEAAFRYSGIKAIAINKKLHTVGESAFDSCKSLSDVFYKGTKAEWDNVVVLKNNDALKNAKFHFEDDVASELNKGLSWSFDPDTGTLYINGEGEIGWNGGELPPWNNHRPDVMKVVIGNGITSLGKALFSDFMYLEEVILPEGITAIGDWTFDSCIFLSKIELPDTIKSIGDFAFWGCSSLQKIRIPGSVETIGMYAFSNCDNLKEVVLENGIVKIGGSAFEHCSSLESITIPETVTQIGYDAFYYCTNLRKVEFNATNCTYAGASDDVFSAFYGCEKLTDVTIGEKVESIPACFLSCCHNIRKIVIPDSVKKIGHHAFWYCDSLSDITIGDNIEKIGGWAFDYTRYVNEEKNFKDNLICLDYCLIGTCGNDIKVDDSITVIQDHVFRSNGNLYSVELPSWMTEIDEFMFDDCWNLTDVKLPENLKKIGAYAFFNCVNLSGLELPKTTETIGDYAFYYCTSITHMRIPNSIKHIADTAFWGCNTIDLHCEEGSYGCYYAEANRMNMSIFMKKAGGYCIVKNGVLTNFYGEGFDDYEYHCNLVIPSNVKSIGYYAFENNKRIVNIELPYSVTTIYPSAFANCPNLESVIIPFTVTDIADSAFEGTDATIYCYYNSYAYNYAVKNGLKYELITVTLSTNSVDMLTGESIGINAVPSVTVASGIPMVWKSSNADVVSVDSAGKLVANGVGSATVGVYSFDGTLFDECSVTVSEPVDEFENVEIKFEDVSTGTLKYGEKILFHINVADLPEGASIKWTTSNSAILRISNENAVCSNHEGCVTCTVESFGNGSAEITGTVVDENGDPVLRDGEEIKVSYTMNSKVNFWQKIIAFFRKLFGISRIILQSVQ